MTQKYAVIVAGGSGSRMGSSTPKQFILLKQKPLLMYTVEAFHEADSDIKIILALPSDYINYWINLCEVYNFTIDHQVIAGGKERYFSVKNALDYIPEKNCLVAIHDGARPLISPELINRLYADLKDYPCVIPVTTPKESIRELKSDKSVAVDRSKYVSVQTPQCFQSEVIKASYQSEYISTFTDDASVAEHSGFPIHLSKGDYKNIKITDPEDLLIAELFI